MGVPILSSLAYVILLDSNYMKVTSEMTFTAVVRIWEGKKKKGGGGGREGGKFQLITVIELENVCPF